MTLNALVRAPTKSLDSFSSIKIDYVSLWRALTNQGMALFFSVMFHIISVILGLHVEYMEDLSHSGIKLKLDTDGSLD